VGNAEVLERRVLEELVKALFGKYAVAERKKTHVVAIAY
jgi:hypothetical protein